MCSNSGVYVLSTVRKGMCVCVRCINVPPYVYSSASETSLQCSSSSLHFDLWITRKAESGRKLTMHTQTQCRIQKVNMDTLSWHKYTDLHTAHTLTANTFLNSQTHIYTNSKVNKEQSRQILIYCSSYKTCTHVRHIRKN